MLDNLLPFRNTPYKDVPLGISRGLILKMADQKQGFWSIPIEDILNNFEATKEGLTSNSLLNLAGYRY
jgi:hypothetical protein